jgi:hypothetical protein
MSVKVFIDRIEEGLAVIVLSEDDEVSFKLPARYLPRGTREGACLRLSFEPDEEAAQTEQQRAEELTRELTKDHQPARKKFKL